MKYISLFAGIGGFDLALNRAGHECVYANEWDKYAAQIYEKNFNKRPDTRDIRAVEASELADFDIIVGGFPCQAFSVAGNRRGFEDTRGTLFYEIARIAAAKRPTYLLLENVKGLLSHDNGRTFETIMRSLDELGYDTQWQVLNSKNHRVPQNRERVFIIGHLRGKPRPQIFPFGADTEKDTRAIGSDISSCLDANYYKGFSPSGHQSKQRQAIVVPTIRSTYHKRGDNDTLVGTYRTHKDGNGFREIKGGVSPTIPARAREDGSGQPIIVQRVPLKFLGRNQKNIEGDYAYTLDRGNTGGVLVDMKIRRLTPVECERLQGFPDGWTEGVSDTQRYKCLGNAVTVNVVEDIISRFNSN